jgi:hypothetical protein
MPMPEIITRDGAKAKGLTHYFTGKPCKHGHVEERLVSTRRCLECNRRAAAAARKADPEANRERCHKWYETHKEEARAYAKAYNAAHREERKAYHVAHHAAHAEQRRAYMMTNYPEQFRAAYDPSRRPFSAAYSPTAGRWVAVDPTTIHAPTTFTHLAAALIVLDEKLASA